MKRKRVTANAIDVRQAPKEIQLWNAGDNATDYGNHRWTKRSVASAFARYKARGNPILIDIEHQGTTLENGEPAPLGGHAELVIRAGSPWLVFDWSDFGRCQIESGERVFLSGEYDVDQDTGEILCIYAVSLVGDPGTHNARQLASAGEGDCMDPVLLAALMAALGNEDPAVAVESVKSLLGEIQSQTGADGGEPPPPATAEAPPGGGEEDKKEEVMTDADPDDKGDVKASAQRPTPKPATQAAPKPSLTPAQALLVASSTAATKTAQTVKASADKADKAAVVVLLETQGKDLEPSVKRWAQTESLETVQRFLASRPAPVVAAATVAATRGATATESETAVPEEEKADIEAVRAMGKGGPNAFRPRYKASSGMNHFPLNTPATMRAHIAAKAAAGGN